MGFLTTLLTCLFFGLTPLAFAVLLLPFLCKNVALSLPRPFLRTHLTLALLARPLLDITARIWLLQPLLAIAIAAPAIFSSFFATAVSFFLLTVVANIDATAKVIFESFGELNPFTIPEPILLLSANFSSAFKEFVDNLDVKEMFKNVILPSGESLGRPRHLFDNGYPFSEAIRNITISESTQHHIEAINVVAVGLLKSIDVSSFFKTTRLPPDLYKSFDTLSEALHSLGENLNFTELLRDGTVPTSMKPSLNSLQDALTTLNYHTNITELYNVAMSSPEVQNALRGLEHVSPRLHDPDQLFQSFAMPSGAKTWTEAVSEFFRWIPLQFYAVLTCLFFFLFVGIPLISLMQAALQDISAWLVSRRYEFSVSVAQRSASGWMFVAATSGLAGAIAEASPYCCFFGLLYASGVLSGYSSLAWLFHTFSAIPVRAASQMRIAEAAVRKDILKDTSSAIFPGFVRAALANCAFNNLWTFSSAILLVLPFAGSLVLGILTMDVFIASFAVLWGRGTCLRALADEQRMIEARQEKRD